MSTLSELVREHTDLGAEDVEALHALVAEWHLLADLSLADLLLWVPLRPGLDPRGRGRLVAVAQVRPGTGPTCYRRDCVGDVVATEEKWLLGRALRERRILRIGGDPEWVDGVPVRAEAVPVVLGRRVVAVLGRDTNLSSSRGPSQLERTYRRSAADLARMVSEGRFPFRGVPVDPETAPRVGDGLVRLDADGRVSFASPNALSAYRRLGLTGNLIGAELDAVTRLLLDDDGDDPRLADVLHTGRPAEAEVAAQGSVVRFRSVPLLPGGERIGALVLLRDVTEVRRRDLALQGKDATIREIHHRVKNNLQTVAALLRLQARRLDAPEARAALEESVRRVSSIALVHESLSETLEGSVDFDAIADRIVAMVAELAQGGEGGSDSGTLRREGRAGELPAEVATSLAMVLTELLQNAVEHGLASGQRAGEVVLRVERRSDGVTLEVTDDGAGLPEGFRVVDCTRLGLSIVRTLVSDAGGSLDLRPRDTGGTVARVEIPLTAASAPQVL